MKKELTAAAVLIALFAAMLVNVHYLGKMTSSLSGEVREAEAFALSGNWGEAEEAAADAAKHWDSYAPYTHITVRHGEIDAASELFTDFLGSIYEKDEAAVRSSARALCEKLGGICSMERLTFGSIF